MRKLLPILFVAFLFFFTLFAGNAFAQAPTSTPAPASGTWAADSEVTFVGKTGARSGEFLDWALQNYDWVCVTKEAASGGNQGRCNNADNPIIPFWILVRNIVYALIALFVLGTAFILVITRGQNVTIMRFIPRFIFVIVLVTLSFSLVQFIYQIGDIVQGFFLRVENKIISNQELLYIGFSYKDFMGYRLVGPQYEESAFISLLLVRLTAITYYVMTGILIVRKIIMWFFIIISPVFPLLLFYSPLRNTAKIWIGEFFRWLLYAPLFALFLHGLVVMWSSNKNIPLGFTFTGAGEKESVIYATATSILLGGPGQAIGIYNSVNFKDTFALYVVALLMLWVVILLPFLLLKIFLDYLATLSFGNNMAIQQVSKSLGFLNPKGSPPAPTSPTPGMPQSAGMARALPFLRSSSFSRASNLRNESSVVHESSEVLRLTNLSIPKMRDVARFESSLLSRDTSRHQEATQIHKTLEQIANPNIVAIPGDREKFTTVREKLMQQKQKGNPVAASILNASEVSRGGVRAQSIGSHVPGAHVGGSPGVTTLKAMSLPTVNKVQQVSIEDYEEVKKMWLENYQTIEPPKGLDGQQVNREQWIKDDIEKINQAITLLSGIDPAKINEGMEMVANILPFLLIGGFSKTEVVSYLKAKLEAAKSTLETANKKDEDEETMVSSKSEKKEEQKEMTMEEKAEVPENEKEEKKEPTVPIIDVGVNPQFDLKKDE